MLFKVLVCIPNVQNSYLRLIFEIPFLLLLNWLDGWTKETGASCTFVIISMLGIVLLPFLVFICSYFHIIFLYITIIKKFHLNLDFECAFIKKACEGAFNGWLTVYFILLYVCCICVFKYMYMCVFLKRSVCCLIFFSFFFRMTLYSLWVLDS